MKYFFIGDSIDCAKLPDNWKPYMGIEYPTIIKTLTQKITVNNPKEHYELVQKLLHQKSND